MMNDGYAKHRTRFEPDGTVTVLGSNDGTTWKVIRREQNPRLDGKPVVNKEQLLRSTREY